MCRFFCYQDFSIFFFYLYFTKITVSIDIDSWNKSFNCEILFDIDLDLMSFHC